MNTDASPPSSEEYKPTLKELDARLYQKELLDCGDQVPSSQSTSFSPADAVHLDSTALAQAVAATVTSALLATQRDPLVSPSPTLTPRAPTTNVLDMALRTSPRSSA
eukprot:CCRYP_006632-RA/>CCRYP_006632-RA protein AED:0.44 eAED:0.44 QI:0/-1/0/1/-1/1/1/0/106